MPLNAGPRALRHRCRSAAPLATLHITNAWHPTSGGVRTFYAALIDEANRAGRRLTVVAPAERSSTERVGRFGRIHFVAAPAAPGFDRRYRLLYPHTYLPLAGGALHAILAAERADVVELCDKYTLPYLAALLRKGLLRGVPRPALVGLTAERFDDNMAAYVSRAPAARRFTRWYLRHVYGPPFDVHLANSEHTAAELRAALHDRPAGFIRVCPPGVGIDDFSPTLRSESGRAAMLGRMGATPQATLLLYAGRLSPEKNLKLLVEALRTLALSARGDFRLVVAGDGPDAGWLRSQASGALEGRILLTGPLDRPLLARLYASCDVFAHPNPREPFGIGPLEAMASGVPVVVPGAGGVLTYADDTNAWLARPESTSFAAAIRSAARGNPARVGAALATTKRFCWAVAARRHFAQYDAIHRELFGRTHRRQPAIAERADALPATPS